MSELLLCCIAESMMYAHFLLNDVSMIKGSMIMLKHSYFAANTAKDIANVGYLIVKLIRATNLPSKKIGSMDPYVVMEIENCRSVSPVRENCLEPEWNLTYRSVRIIIGITKNIVVDSNAIEYGTDGYKGPQILKLLKQSTIKKSLSTDQFCEAVTWYKDFGDLP